MFYATLLEMITSIVNQSTYAKQLFEITFEQGPEQVKVETLKVVNQMIADKQIDQLQVLCRLFQSILGTIANIFGDWISTFIPDDAGLTGMTISMIVSSAPQQAYQLLIGLYQHVPEVFKNLLQQSNSLT